MLIENANLRAMVSKKVREVGYVNMLFQIIYF